MNKRQNHLSLFTFAGEHSGDLHGGALLEALRKRQPDIDIFGVGGPEMRAQGLSMSLPMEQFQVFGFADILMHFPRLWRQFQQTRDLILSKQPDGVLLIDYPGLNMRLARALRENGYRGKIVHYICPTVWAWGQGRIQKLAGSVDLLLTIFPFEPALFANTALPVHFVGHPLVERIERYQYDSHWMHACGITRPKCILGLFPGSRTGEIQRLFPRMLDAALKLRERDPEVCILVSLADESLRQIIQHEIRRISKNSETEVILIPKRFTYELMRDSHTVLTKSGTVTLELALHNKPSVVIYDISPVNKLIARYILRLKLPYYCIVNILCGETIYPEFIEQNFCSKQLADALSRLHVEGPERSRCLEGCQKTREALKTPSGQSVADTAAALIKGML